MEYYTSCTQEVKRLRNLQLCNSVDESCRFTTEQEMKHKGCIYPFKQSSKTGNGNTWFRGAHRRKCCFFRSDDVIIITAWQVCLWRKRGVCDQDMTHRRERRSGRLTTSSFLILQVNTGCSFYKYLGKCTCLHLYECRLHLTIEWF